MGLFSLFNRKNQNAGEVQGVAIVEKPEIPEDVFIQKDNTSGETNVNANGQPANTDNGIHLLYAFLEKNHEKRGYDDALINPDSSHLDQNIEALKNDLERTIKKVRTFYEDFITVTEFHIASRSRSGMVDTVEELTMKKNIADSHIKKVLEVEEDTRNNTGDCKGIIISYTRGFKNGLAAISHHDILKRKF